MTSLQEGRGVLRGYSPDQILEAAQGSPAAVARHDREAWVALFSRHGIIEDPVGSVPHHNGLHDRRSGVRGPGPLWRFFDTFIAPNNITFHVEHDVVAGSLVVRDVAIELTMAAGLQVRVPMHLIYEVTEEDGVLKIAHLRAYWELFPMIAQVLGKGAAGLATMNRLGLRMIANQGLGGVLGFCRGMLGIHAAGKDAVRRFVDAANGRSAGVLAGLFDGKNEGIVLPGGGEVLSPTLFGERFDGTLSVSKLISAGYETSCSFALRTGEAETAGVGFFAFNSRTRRLHSVRLFGN